MTKRIAAFGEVMMRMQAPGNLLLSQADTLHYSFSGTGVNVLTALSQFGHTGKLITTLPKNSLGNAALAHVRKLGISSSLIRRDGQYLGLYFLESGFGVRPSSVTYSNRLESSFNTTQIHSYDFKEIAKHIDVVHFCGITLAMNDTVREQMKLLAKTVKENGGTVVFDCNYRPSLWGEENGYELAKPHYEEMLQLADLVMMNEKDAIFTLGMSTRQFSRKEQLEELIPVVAEKFNIKSIAGTHRTINGDNTHSLTGYIFSDNKFDFSDHVSFSVLDRIGAGDAFSSGIIHGFLTKFSNNETVNFATHAAMLAHTYVGDSPLATVDDIIKTTESNISDVKR